MRRDAFNLSVLCNALNLSFVSTSIPQHARALHPPLPRAHLYSHHARACMTRSRTTHILYIVSMPVWANIFYLVLLMVLFRVMGYYSLKWRANKLAPTGLCPRVSATYLGYTQHKMSFVRARASTHTSSHDENLCGWSTRIASVAGLVPCVCVSLHVEC